MATSCPNSGANLSCLNQSHSIIVLKRSEQILVLNVKGCVTKVESDTWETSPALTLIWSLPIWEQFHLSGSCQHAWAQCALHRKCRRTFQASSELHGKPHLQKFSHQLEIWLHFKPWKTEEELIFIEPSFQVQENDGNLTRMCDCVVCSTWVCSVQLLFVNQDFHDVGPFH